MLTRPSRNGTWTTSSYSDIPTPPEGVTEVIKHCYVIAGGLALILSRSSEQRINAHLQYTRDLYDQLRDDLKTHGKTNANAKLLSEVMHETAQSADPATKAALHYVFAARCEFEKKMRATKSIPASTRDMLGLSMLRTFRATSADRSEDIGRAKDRLKSVLDVARSRRA